MAFHDDNPPVESGDQRSSTRSPTSKEEYIQLTIKHGGKTHAYDFPTSATLSDLSDRVSGELSIPPANQKFIISPKPGMIKGPVHETAHASLPLSTITSRKISLLGSTPAQIASIDEAIASASIRTRGTAAHAAHAAASSSEKPSYLKPAQPSRTRDWKTLQDAATYTFLDVRPLDHLPNPSRSAAFLARLRDDPGVKHAMASHKWAVPLLTEMDPADHTTHEGRTLGLNRNGGEVIELRLRTDAYDGYRDYRTIRKTLCHELAHNVHGEHNEDFWRLCREVEREVARHDWKSGGRALTDEVFYGSGDGDGDVVADHGAWTGGEYVLGGRASKPSAGADGVTSAGSGSLNRREVLARAAEERVRKGREAGNGEGESR